jgi:hypothetical protein
MLVHLNFSIVMNALWPCAYLEMRNVLRWRAKSSGLRMWFDEDYVLVGGRVRGVVIKEGDYVRPIH